MKKICKINRILAFLMCFILLFCGCARQEATFVDVSENARLQETEPDTGESGFVAKDDLMQEDLRMFGQSQMVSKEQEQVVVHICGAVRSPGVYTLPAGSRIVDAVDMAGGMKVEAQDCYVNLAAFLADGEQIFIPTKEEALSLEPVPEGMDASSGKVNINTADKALLCTLPGVGDAKAEEIIAYRQKHGNFLAIEDIMLVNGIKEGGFQKIKEQIVVK